MKHLFVKTLDNRVLLYHPKLNGLFAGSSLVAYLDDENNTFNVVEENLSTIEKERILMTLN